MWNAPPPPLGVLHGNYLYQLPEIRRGDYVSFSIVIQCPLHPNYQGKAAPTVGCKGCRLVLSVRNETSKVLSTPREERTDLNEIIIKGIE